MFAKPGINPIPRYLLKITTTQPYKKQIEIIQSKLTCQNHNSNNGLWFHNFAFS